MGVPLLSNKLSLLGLIGQACGELGLDIPSSIIGSSDPNSQLYGYLATRVATDIYKYGTQKGGWTACRGLHTFNIASSGLITGTFTSGSNIITSVSDTSAVVAGMQVQSYGNVVYPTTVVSTTSNTITMSANATTTATAISFYCGQDTYSLPSDYAYSITQTAWDGNFRWQLLGPLEAQEWAVLKYGISPTGPRRRFRIMNNQFFVDPVPNDNGSLLAYEYYSFNYAQQGVLTTSTQSSRFLNDTDYFLMDDDVFVHGIKWRYKQRAGLDFSTEKDDYQTEIERALARDGFNRDLPLNAMAGQIRLLGGQNVPDSGYGS